MLFARERARRDYINARPLLPGNFHLRGTAATIGPDRNGALDDEWLNERLLQDR